MWRRVQLHDFELHGARMVRRGLNARGDGGCERRGRRPRLLRAVWTCLNMQAQSHGEGAHLTIVDVCGYLHLLPAPADPLRGCRNRNAILNDGVSTAAASGGPGPASEAVWGAVHGRRDLAAASSMRLRLRALPQRSADCPHRCRASSSSSPSKDRSPNGAIRKHRD